MLEREARLIMVNDTEITRTSVPVPVRSSGAILEDLLSEHPENSVLIKLNYHAGSQLASVLSGACDGLKLLFGTEEARELVSGLYSNAPLNKASYKQMEDFIRRLVSTLPVCEGEQGPFKILEMGAGTGGTTQGMAQMLASLQIPVEYTFTDLSPSLVAAARKRFKAHPFMKFRVHDIEKAPADDLLHSQHIVIASNAVHATRSLSASARNIRNVLRPDGFLLMLEMTETIYWIDMVFGVLEGWWLFDDGRQHALAHQSAWERTLRSAGYGHVAWTDGESPETNLQRVFLALAS